MSDVKALSTGCVKQDEKSEKSAARCGIRCVINIGEIVKPRNVGHALGVSDRPGSPITVFTDYWSLCKIQAPRCPGGQLVSAALTASILRSARSYPAFFEGQSSQGESRSAAYSEGVNRACDPELVLRGHVGIDHGS